MKIVSNSNITEHVIFWKRHKSDTRYWVSEINDKLLFLRMNNFPEEPMYSFISKNKIIDFDDLPERWILS